MSTAPRTPRMTRDAFLAWVQTQEGRWEFDGFAPVAMTGGTRNHDRICRNIQFALWSRLRGGPCEVLGPTAGIAAGEDVLRYPNALVTCTPGPGTSRVVPGPVIGFEVVSPSSSRTDRLVKLREHRRAPSILRHVIVESTTAGLTLHARSEGEAPWTTVALTAGETLPLPEIGIEGPVSELFEGLDFEGVEDGEE